MSLVGSQAPFFCLTSITVNDQAKMVRYNSLRLLHQLRLSILFSYLASRHPLGLGLDSHDLGLFILGNLSNLLVSLTCRVVNAGLDALLVILGNVLTRLSHLDRFASLITH